MNAVVESVIFGDGEERAAGSGFGVIGAKDESLRSSQNDRSGAHGTRFERNVDRCSYQEF